jgi:uncharacterized repeat protein (TIGR01451 family)
MLNKLLFSIAASGLLAGSALAQGVTLTAAVMQEKVVEEAGVKHVAAGTIVPGQEVVYDLAFANKGTKPAEQVVLTNPVPATLEYVSGENALVSVDGGKTFAALGALKVTAADGTQRAAEPKDVTHLRWNLAAIAPGSGGHVRFKARLK